jgi:pimeloyl-ACP methyl ester carboxylesterase
MLKESSLFNAEPFSITIPDQKLQDLHARIRSARWPQPSAEAPWEQGTHLEYLQAICRYWTNDFDWRAQERSLNRFHHYRATVEDVGVHFVHERARNGDGIPLILMHGWPSTFLEYLPLVPLLTDPASHGITGPAFDVVLPSLPGYAFSERPARRMTYRDVARLLIGLMEGLGYERYGAGGTDFGSGVATFMALHNPLRLIGVHLTNLELSPYIGTDSRPLTDAEQRYIEESARWNEIEGAYRAILSTKPQTLAFGLNDSPVGLAAWILEKWRSWSDCGGELDRRLPRDFLLTVATLYWLTETIATSIRDYSDNRRSQGEPRLGPEDRVKVPTGFAVFSHNFISEGEPPREWAERLYNIVRWTPMPRGGHFAAVEEPELLARDICAFFAGLR